MEEAKIQIITFFDESDYTERHKILLDNVLIWYAYDLANDCPEDATLSRDMANAFDIVKLMEKVEGRRIRRLPTIECKTQDEFDSY